jgi:hypothetical protein
MHLNFCLREAADEAVLLYNKNKKHDIEHTVSKWQMQLNYTGTS